MSAFSASGQDTRLPMAAAGKMDRPTQSHSRHAPLALVKPTLDVDRTYRSHSHVVYRRAMRILKNDQDAREVVQEVFLSLLERPEQFAGRSSITTWLYSVTTHHCLNRIRRHKVRVRLNSSEVAFRSPTEDAPRATSMTMAQQMLAQLPRQLACVAMYYYVDEMSHREIAEVMGCSRRQVGYLVQRLQKALQKERGK